MLKEYFQGDGKYSIKGLYNEIFLIWGNRKLVGAMNVDESEDNSLILGWNNEAYYSSFLFGWNNRGSNLSFIYGCANRAWDNTFIMGAGNVTVDDPFSGVPTGKSDVSFALGIAAASTNYGSFVWNFYPGFDPNDDGDTMLSYPKYYSHGVGSFNINPVGGLSNFWVGETNMSDHVVNIVAPLAIGMKNQVISDLENGNIIPYKTDNLRSANGDTDYTATDLLTKATNASVFAVNELARTNSVLANGPYVKSLSAATNYANTVAEKATNYTDSAIAGIRIDNITDGVNTIEANRTVTYPIYEYSSWNIVTVPENEYTPSYEGVHWANTEEDLEGRYPFSGAGWYLYESSNAILVGTDINATNMVYVTTGGTVQEYTTVMSRSGSVSMIITNKVALVSEIPINYMPMTADGYVKTENGFYFFGMNNKDYNEETNTIMVIDGGHYQGGTLIINGSEGDESNGIKIQGAQAGAERGDILVNGVSLLNEIDGKQDGLPYPTNAIPYAAISGTPSLSGYATHSEVNAAAKDGTNYTDSIAQSIKRITDGINVINSDRTVTVANYTFGNWSYTRSDDNHDIDGLPVWVTSEEELNGRSGWDGMGWYAYSGSSAYIISSNSNATNLVKDIEGTIFTFSREVTSVSTAGDVLALESDLGGYLPVSQNGGISFNNSRLALIGGEDDYLEPQLTIGGGHYSGGSLVVNDNYDSSGGITISGASEGESRGSIRVNGIDVLETIDRAVETNSMQDTAISAKQDKLPYETNSIPYAVISGTPNMSLYQTKLPYPTNAIPYSSISGTPSLSVYAMHTDVSNAATAATNYTDMAVSNKLDASSSYQQWLPSGSYIPGAVVSYAGKLWKANAPLEPGDRPPASNIDWLPTTVDSQKQDRLTTAQVNNINSVPNKQDKLPYSTNSIPYSVISGVPDGMTTNVVKNIITNSVPSWSDWTYSGDIAAGVTYNIVSSQNGGGFSFRLYDFSTDTLLATAASLEEHPATILFSVTGGTITATRTRAYYSDVVKVDGKVNAVSNWVENMDTSYFRTNVAVAASATRVVCPSNQNQTVQYINAPAGVSTIEISLPKDGMTKDWLVYILATDEINIVLPPANYWATSETVTNKIEASTATALYFSQISDNIYSIGRQDNLVPITVLSTREVLMQSIREKSKTKRRLAR